MRDVSGTAIAAAIGSMVCLCAAAPAAGPTDPGAYLAEVAPAAAHNPVPARSDRAIDRSGPGICYVDDTAPPGGDGSSWATALNDLQQALAEAAANPGIVEIRVAEGSYKPDAETGDIHAAFFLRNNLRVLGGFPDGGGDTDQRDPAKHPTILDGDLNDDDGPQGANRADNTRNVVIGSGLNDTAVLDGFVVQGGATPLGGAGLFVSSGDPTVIDTTFRFNRAGLDGGGALVIGGATRFEGCSFELNHAGRDGGGLTLVGAIAELRETRFTTNSAHREGGGLFASDSDLEAARCAFTTNRAGLEVPPAPSAGGGAALRRVAAELVECSFVSNQAIGAAATADGGALFFAADEDGPQGDALITGGFFENNTARRGGAIYTEGHTVALADLLFEANEATLAVGAASGRGGAIAASASPGAEILRMDSCEFLSNHAVAAIGKADLDTPAGGAIWANAGVDARACTFMHNSASIGGAIAGPATLNADRCVLSANHAALTGGAIAGATLESLSNSALASNSADVRGGAMADVTGVIANCTVVLNDAATTGGIDAPDLLSVFNSILSGNTHDAGGSTELAQASLGLPIVQHTLVEGLSLYAGPGNIGGDPLVLEPLGPDAAPGTGDEVFSLSSASPCLDAGDNTLTLGLPLDLLGFDRVQNFGGGTSDVDMGAVEGRDCNGNNVTDVEEVLFGNTEDCNGNLIPDSCDVAAGSQDCNNNGLIDSCELEADPSLDCDGSGILDSCELTGAVELATGDLGPFFFGSRQQAVFEDVPAAISDVSVLVSSNSDLGLSSENVQVLLDSQLVDVAFDTPGVDCALQTDNLIIPADDFNAAAADGTIVIDFIASPTVDNFCANPFVSAVLLVPTSADCNNNGVPDACDIADGTSEDCDGNGRPDECDIQGLVYLFDDGVSEDRYGVPGGGDVAWMSQFDVVAGSEVIVAIDIAWDDSVLAGTPTTLALLDDPNNDRDPRDGFPIWTDVVPSRSDVSRGDTLFRIPIPPTNVGAVGDSFFVVALMTHDDGVTPAIYDETPPLRNATWLAASLIQGGMSIFNLNATSQFFDRNLGFGEGGHYLLRAVGITNAADCNANGVPDECDIADGTSDDINGNGIPDECEGAADCPGDVTLDGAVDIFDFAELADAFGTAQAATHAQGDLDGDGDVDSFDFAILAADYGCTTTSQ